MAQSKERTGKPALLKELNIGLIMDVLQKKGEATRVELAALTELSQPTVNLLIGELVKDRIVLSLGIAESTGGRRAEVFALNAKRAALAAVVIRHDRIEAVVTDLDFSVELHEQRERTEGASCTEELISLLQMLFEKRPKIRAICVGVPGSVSEDGEVFSVPMIPEWEHFALKKELESRFPALVCVMNDMNAIAAGYLPGNGKRNNKYTKNFVYLHAEGAGTGAGIVIDGKVYSGFRSFAGEIGSMILGTADHLTGSGRGKKSGEEVLSHPRDAETAYRKISVEGYMRNAADHSQRNAILTAAAVNLICVLNPEEILFGGEVTTEAAEEIFEGCRAYLPESVLPRFQVIPDYQKAYFDGLCRQGRELLNRHIQIV